MAAEVEGTDARPGPPRRDWPLVALTAGFVLLVLAVLATIWLTVRMQQATQLVRHTLEIENNLSLVLSRLQDAETSAHGFLLTGRSEFLQPYEETVRTLPGDLARLRQDVADNPRQAETLDGLRERAILRLAHLRVTVDHYWQGTPTSPEFFLRGKAIMDDARDSIAAMRAEETRLLESRTQLAGRRAVLLAASLVLSVVLVLVFGLSALASSRRRLAEAEAAGEALTESNRLLMAEAGSRAAAEDALRQAQKIEAVGQLTGGIAHDFNNMLTLVIGSLDLVKRRLAGGETEKAARGIDTAMEGAGRAAQLTQRLLAFARRQPLAPQPLDANKLVTGMSELLLRTLGERVALETRLAGGLWRTFVDPNQLENCLVNLCVNARDAMPEGGRLIVETANAEVGAEEAADHGDIPPGAYVAIAVSDTGAGMPPEVAARAFDPFFTTKAPGRGTGLGLSQVYGFVKQSNGHVHIETVDGEGTTVRILLPRHIGDGDGQAPERPAETAPPRALPGEAVLVVEDDARVRQISVDALGELGYAVLQAPGPREGLAMLADGRRIDLLFTDVVMPDMNGRQLADRARAARPELKVLYTTGYTRDAIVHDGMLDTGVIFLPKPFTVDQLAHKVREVLDETVG
jgi:signal transduction histidine kinase/CheY-like chemotaxis protein